MNSKLLLKASEAILRVKRMSETHKHKEGGDLFKERTGKKETKTSGAVTAINSNKRPNDKALAYMKNASLSLAGQELSIAKLSASANTSKALFPLGNELDVANKPVSTKRLKIRICCDF